MSISPVGAGVLSAGISGAGGIGSCPSGNADEAKIRELEKKLQSLTEEKKKAEQNHDAEKVRKLEEEIRKVRQELEELKRKAEKKEEKEGQKPGKEGRPPCEGTAGQYLNTWA